ncbi:MAG TPA: PilT/PilU family type 4a pilus ATPase [Sulfurivirga caldicuralii]|nr:PilT/PilU family type 4a pilus ATPase [Sulfurivirga caldicuralii]
MDTQLSPEESKQAFEDALLALHHQGGSDLYIEAGAPIAIRIDGKMHFLAEERLSPQLAEQIILAGLTAQQLKAFKRQLEYNFAYSIPGVGRFRVNIFMQRGTPALVARTIKTDIPNLETLGLPSVVQELIMKNRGLILFVGGTGTGKSTSLASLIDYRNRHSKGHIITIEDPIEFIHRHKRCIVSQREVGTDTLSYFEALKNALRQAPDVIMIGEIREQETMEHAISFAETGHLCLSTLHANNANQALDRIINFFPEEKRSQLLMDLSFNLLAIVSQRLIPKIGGGRVAAVEILIGTQRIKDLIFKGDIQHLKEAMAVSREVGMQTFDQHILELFDQGLISYDNAMRYADAPNDVRLKIKLAGKLPEEAQTLHTIKPTT